MLLPEFDTAHREKEVDDLVMPVVSGGRFTPSEVAKHNSRENCWIIVNGRVLDVTEFLGVHPGGEKSIMNFAGKDASKMFNMIHSPDVIEKYLPEKKIMGIVADAEKEALVVPKCTESLTTLSPCHSDEASGSDSSNSGEVEEACEEYWLVLGGAVHNVTAILPGLLEGADESILSYGGMRMINESSLVNSETEIQLEDGSRVSIVDFSAVGDMGSPKGILMSEVAKHCTDEDCYIVVNGEVIDVSSFLCVHPGGKECIMNFAGRDASEKYNLVHPKGYVAKYVPELVLGRVVYDTETVTKNNADDDESVGKRYGIGFCYLVVMFVKEVLRSIFTVENYKVLSDRSGLTRSAMFLMTFVTIHALGNVHLFFGPEHFNGYAYFLNHHIPFIGSLARPIEIYLLLAGIMHVVVAITRIVKFRKERISMKDWEMAITGVILLIFLLVHLLQFRLASESLLSPFSFRASWLPPFFCSREDTSCDVVRVGDLHKAVFDLFASPFWVLFYSVGSIACLMHMRDGLQRIIRSSDDIPYKYNPTVQFWGYVMAWVVGMLFLSFPVYAFLHG